VYRRPEAAAYLGLTRKTLDTYIHLGKIRKPFKLTPGGRADGYTEDMLIEIQQAAIKASEPRRKVERFRYRKAG
jgi:predicted DNA-binding transcriptional regulator AlpA